MFKKSTRIAILSALLLSSCAFLTEFNYRKVDKEIKPYFDSYSELLAAHCPKYKFNNFYSIKLTKSLKKRSWIGVCFTKINGYSIEIVEDYWFTANDTQRKQLMYHEFAHCMINRSHEEGSMGHYMYPQLFNIPEPVYMDQVVEDILNYCKEL